MDTGIDIGKKEEKIIVAKNMLLENVSLEIIQKVTELSKEEILNLQKNET